MPSLGPLSVAGALRRLVLMVGVSGLCGVLLAGLALPLAAGVGLAARSGATAFDQLPSDFEAAPLAQRSRFTDRDGRTIATFYDENRVYVRLSAIAPVMKDAMLAIEDDRFYRHGPIDVKGTMRALVRNFQAGEVAQGGSTLTQQYVKNLLVAQADTEAEISAATETSYTRKLRELRLAVAAEKEMTKDEILEGYLNIAYFGNGVYGVYTAAQYYFSTTAAKLTLPQAALIAGLAQLPTSYDPVQYPERALARRNVVVTRMAELGMIPAATASKARKAGLGLRVRKVPNGCASSDVPFFCDYVYRELLAWKGLGETVEERERMVRRGGIRVATTLDRSYQKAAQSTVSDYVHPRDRAVAAVAMVEPRTGEVKALAHSRRYGEGEGRTFINYAVDRARGGGLGFQAGSAFKPYVLAAAIRQGIPLTTYINSPGQATITAPYETCDGQVSDTWNVSNYDGGGGTYNLLTGTWRSVNTFYAQLEGRTGICDPWKIATNTGVTRSDGEPLQQYKTFVLGVNEVSPLTMAESYATFAARGVHCNPVAILEVQDRNRKKLPVPEADCKRVMSRSVADGVNAVLRGVIDGPDPGRTGQRMSIGRPAAGKTGTTNDAKAVWFVGYVPQLSTAVAIGDPDPPQDSLTGVTLGGTYYSSACGGCIPGPIWKDIMDRVVSGLPVKSFANPDPGSVPGTSIEVPDVRGMGQSAATDQLRSRGLQAEVGGVVDSYLGEGLVVYTSPSAGSTIGSGSTVRLYLSSGNAPAPERRAAADDRDSGDDGDTAGAGTGRGRDREGDRRGRGGRGGD